MTRVLIVDDHPIVLQGCRQVLQDAGVCEILEANSAVAAYRVFRRNCCEVVIVDLAMQGNRLGGLDLIRRMHTHDHGIPILVLSMHDDPFIVGRALEAGAIAYVLKDAGPGDFLEAFDAVRNGKPYMAHEIAVQVAIIGARRNTNPLGDLSPRELQMVTLLAAGKQYSEVAEELNLSYKTVANTCSQIKGKLGARNLPELIRVAIQYISSPDLPLRDANRP